MTAIWTSPHFMERRTATHVYFLTGPGSNWYPSVFEQSLSADGPLLTFNSREQYIMARKKLAMGDRAGMRAVMEVGPPDMRPIVELLATNPREALRLYHPYAKEQKRIGRMPPYDEAVWAADRGKAAYAALLADSSQNQAVYDWIMGTGRRRIVEGSRKDETWAVGVAWDDDRILDEANYRGGNLLGRTWELVRGAHERTAHLRGYAAA